MAKQLSKVQKAFIFVLGELDELIKHGLVARTDGSERLTSLGAIQYRRLKAEGFEPTTAELEAVTQMLKADSGD